VKALAAKTVSAVFGHAVVTVARLEASIRVAPGLVRRLLGI
jgi:hypothetical protein